MKTSMRILAAAAALLILCLCLTACGDDPIVGTWAMDAEVNPVDGSEFTISYTFNADGTGTLDAGDLHDSLSYKLLDGQLQITYTSGSSRGSVVVFDYTIEDDALTLKSTGAELVFHRK